MPRFSMLVGSWRDDKEPTQIPFNAVDLPGVGSWLSGRVLQSKPRNPIQMLWEDELAGGGLYWELFPQPDPTALRSPEGYRRLSSYLAGPIPLIRREIGNALGEAGVDNVDYYPVEVFNTQTGECCNDYLAINIVGVVRAADMQKSKAVAHNAQGLVSVDFDSLALDESSIRDLKLFRLAECVTGIVIRDDVKQYLESLGGFGLVFADPMEWSG